MGFAIFFSQQILPYSSICLLMKSHQKLASNTPVIYIDEEVKEREADN